MSKRKKHKKSSVSRAKVMALLHPLETKGDLKNSGIETLKSLGFGVVGGGIAAAAVGKSSLAWGALTTFVGHYTKSTPLTSFGLGMMATGGYQIGQGAVNGAEMSGLEGAKERVKSFASQLKERLYINRLMPGRGAEGTDGMGNVKYFKYPNESQHIDMGSLDNIEREIALAGEHYGSQMTGSDDDIAGVEDRLY
jgi:hypothetical protein